MRKRLRRRLAEKIRELNLPTKLYRGSKFQFYRRFSSRWIRELLDKLELCTPGTVVEDCDYFNHVVKGFRPDETFQHSNRAWYGRGRGYFFDFDQVEFEDGRWSCGCPASPCPPSTREDIEQGYLTWCREKDVENAIDSFTKKPYPEVVRRRYRTLVVGGHIVDARGVMLPEFASEQT